MVFGGESPMQQQVLCPVTVVRVDPENKPNLVKLQLSNVSPRLSSIYIYNNVGKVEKNIFH